MIYVIVALLVVVVVLQAVIVGRLDHQSDVNKDMAAAYRTLAASLAKEAKSALKVVTQTVDKGKQDVTAAVEKGVQAATDAAATLAATIVVPPSGDKIPKPVLPDGC